MAGLAADVGSAVLMAAPCADGPVEIRLAGEMVSEPYVEMTLAAMRQFGVSIDRPQPGLFRSTHQTYHATDYDIEPDASAASYFFGLAAVTGGTTLKLAANMTGLLALSSTLAQRSVTAYGGQVGINVAF